MEAAAQELSGQLHLGFFYALDVPGISLLRDVLRQSLERNFLVHEVSFVAHNDAFRVAISDVSDDGGEGDDSRRQAICSWYRVHQRGLASAESSDDDQIEPVLGRSGEQVPRPLSPCALVRRRKWDLSQQLSDRKFVLLVFAQVHADAPKCNCNRAGPSLSYSRPPIAQGAKTRLV
jgi:hypothetical protein